MTGGCQFAGWNQVTTHSEHACNCDKNDDVWREDSGLLTDKTKLPVIELRFGDNDKPQEEGHHALGKFMCYGTA